jgi:hypothetical protein
MASLPPAGRLAMRAVQCSIRVSITASVKGRAAGARLGVLATAGKRRHALAGIEQAVLVEGRLEPVEGAISASVNCSAMSRSSRCRRRARR